MSGASAYVLQMVRAHYRGDSMAFAAAAASLARAAKSPTIGNEIADLIRRGSVSRPAGPSGNGAGQPARKVAPTHRALQALPPLTFEELLLEAELQAFLDELVVELEYREELAARKLRARSRFLFHGPPGNGKTSSAAALGNALGVDAFCVSIPQTVGSHVGETSQNLAEIFGAIRPGMVVVFDEIDAIGSARGMADQAASKEMNATVNTMLTLLDRHRGGVIVATTNRPDILDAALLRRFDEQIFFPAPSLEQMRSLARKLCDKFEIAEVAVDHCANLDEVTKTVEREARRAVMRELLAADTAEDEGPESPEGGDAH